jgi:O-antigen ligase
MGFVLSILYFVTYYLTPVTLFGPLAVIHIELILAALLLLISLPALLKSFLSKTPQTTALIGLAFATLLSVLTTGWAGGAVQAFLVFIPNPFGYFSVCLFCNTKKRLQTIVLMMLFVCLFVIARGYTDLVRGVARSGQITRGATQSPYILAQSNDAGETFFRLKGRGEIDDPNDFAQLIVCTVPLLFIFWRPKKSLRNFLIVLLPVGVLLFGTYLTRSRGSLLAMLAMLLVAARRRIGTVPAIVLAVGLFVGAQALHFAGGRDISAEAGSGRTELWGEGLQMLKSHPVFGVGFGRMPDLSDSGHTAHNSVVVCAAELGMLGLYFWSLFLFPTVRDALAIASPEQITEGVPIVPEESFFPQIEAKIDPIDKAEINRLGRLLLLSLTGFLVAAWFLSRAFVMTLFVLGGLVEVVFEMAVQRGMIAPRLRLSRAMQYAVLVSVLLLVLVYVMIRILNLSH